jgi:hypothetical protein
MKALGALFTLSQDQNILVYTHVNGLASIYAVLLANALKGAEGSDACLWGTEYMQPLVKVLSRKGITTKDAVWRLGNELLLLSYSSAQCCCDSWLWR